MPFGQQPGPPASARRVQHLTSLVRAAGHTDLRDARGPLGLTQRQAGGRFTRDEAEELIARLEAEAEEAQAGGGDPGPAPHPPPVAQRDTRRARELRQVPDGLLAAELQRRGWIVVEP